MWQVDMTSVQSTVCRTLITIRTRYIECGDDFDGGPEQHLVAFLARLSKSRKVTVDGVDKEGRPRKHSFELHEEALKGYSKTPDDLQPCLDVCRRHAKSTLSHLQSRLGDLESLNGVRLFMPDTCPDDKEKCAEECLEHFEILVDLFHARERAEILPRVKKTFKLLLWTRKKTPAGQEESSCCGHAMLPNALPSALSNALLSALPIALISKALLLHTSDSRRGDVNGFAAIAHVFSWRPRRRRGGRRKAARSSATSRRPPSLPGAIRVVPCNVPLPRNGESLGVAEQGAPPPGGSHGSRAPLGAHARAATCPQQPHRRQQLATWHALLPACTFFDTSVLMGRRRQEWCPLGRGRVERARGKGRGTQGNGENDTCGFLDRSEAAAEADAAGLQPKVQAPSAAGHIQHRERDRGSRRRYLCGTGLAAAAAPAVAASAAVAAPAAAAGEKYDAVLLPRGRSCCARNLLPETWCVGGWCLLDAALSSITVITGRVSTALLGKPKSNLRAPVLAGERSGVARAERRQHPNRSLQSTSRFYPKMSPCMAVWQFLGCLITGSIITHQERVESIGSKASTHDDHASYRAASASDRHHEDEVVSIKTVSCWHRYLLGDLIFVVLSVLSIGIIPLLASWFPAFYVTLRFKRVPPGDVNTDYVLVESLDGILTVASLESVDPWAPSRGWVDVATARTCTRRPGCEISFAALPRTFLWRSERFWFDPAAAARLFDGTPKSATRAAELSSTPLVWKRHRFQLASTAAALHKYGAACAMQEPRGASHPGDVSDWERRFLTHGPNILHVHAPSFWVLLLGEVLKPFFVFQVFSVIVWFLINYYLYSCVIIFLTTTSVVYEAAQTRRNRLAIKRLAETDCSVVRLTARRDSADPSAAPRLQPEQVLASELLPGDLVQVEAGMVLPCDLVLLAGQCVLNESMLTGESAPVLKTALPLDFSAQAQSLRPGSEADSKYRLLSGTEVLQTRALRVPPTPPPTWPSSSSSGEVPPCVWNFANASQGQPMPVTAMVVGTGYATAKGELVRAIIYPKPMSFDFERKLYLFIVNLFVFFLIAAVITVIYQYNKVSTRQLVLSVLNILTITVPPALPLALSIGLTTAFSRLQACGIFCINPPRIINAGRVNLLCFDKTGTLTRDGLTISGAIPVSSSSPSASSPAFSSLHSNLLELYLEAVKPTAASPQPASTASTPTASLCYTLAACHSLSLLHGPAPSRSDSASSAADAFPEMEVHAERTGGDGFWSRLMRGEWGYEWVKRASKSSSGSVGDEGTHGGRLHAGPRSDEGEQWGGGVGEAEVEEGEAGEGEESAVVHMKDGSVCLFVGDPLEIQMFRRSGEGHQTQQFLSPTYLSSPLSLPPSPPSPPFPFPHPRPLQFPGWQFLPRPESDHHDTTNPSSSSAPPPTNAWDINTIWSHPNLPHSVDLLLLPPSPSDPSAPHNSHHLLPPVASASSFVFSSQAALAVLRHFDFDSDLRRMAVAVLHVHPAVVRSAGGEGAGADGGGAAPMSLLVKGAPERCGGAGWDWMCGIRPLCTPTSLPRDFEAQLKELTLGGSRVLAVASRSLSHLTLQQVAETSRADMEKELVFCGFLVLENPIKPETTPVLHCLAAAGLRCLMVTGDNPLTALAVSRHCGPYLLHTTRHPYLIDTADDTQSGGTRCVIQDVVTHRSVPLDDVLIAGPSGAASVLQKGSSDGAKAVPQLDASLRGADLVVTGRAFTALKAHHDRLSSLHRPPRRSSSAFSPAPTPSSSSTALVLAPASAAITPFEAVLSRAGVFARMSPSNKQDLMLALRDLGYSVAMTGDGANDSAALKAADVGLSIASKRHSTLPDLPSSRSVNSTSGASSSASVALVRRSSVAVARSAAAAADAAAAAPSIAAPFSTHVAHIGALVPLLRDGRCALVTATSMFKYMMFYAMVQTMSIAVLYPLALELTDMQYLWADLGLVFPMILLIPTLLPRKSLSRGLPETNLFSLSMLVGVYGQSALIVATQLLAYAFLQRQPWYVEPIIGTPGFNRKVNINTTASFLFASFQYLFLAAAVSQSFGRFRAHLFQSPLLILVLLLQFLCCTLLLLYPSAAIRDAFGLVDLSAYPDFTMSIWVFAIITGVAFILFERFAVRHQSAEPDTADADDLLRQAAEWQAKDAAAGSAPSHGSAHVWIGHGDKEERGSQGWYQQVVSVWRNIGGSCYPGPSIKDIRFLAAQKEAGALWDRL
ncbi:unnamed protein product [Closterium sp. NIES-53]